MIRVVVTSLFGGILLFGLVPAMAAEGSGFCATPNVHCEEVPNDCPAKAEIEGKSYCFRDEGAKSYVMNDPKLRATLTKPVDQGIRLPPINIDCFCLASLVTGKCSGVWVCR